MGEDIKTCSGCDRCSSSINCSIDGLSELVKLLFLHPFLYTRNDVIEILKGNKEYNIAQSCYRLLSDWRDEDIASLLKSCINVSIIFELKNHMAINFFKLYQIKRILKSSSQ